MSTDFSYDEYLALVLIYTANASDGISLEEYNFISEKVKGSHYNTAMEFFDGHSEVEVIERINELTKIYASDSKEKVFKDVQQMIHVDEDDKVVEEQILRFLKKLI